MTVRVKARGKHGMYAESMAEPVINTMLRFPPDLHAALVAIAKEERRSLNAHVIYVLEQYVIEREKETARDAANPA
jgi:predicted HicB family RNase H-like nuclease